MDIEYEAVRRSFNILCIGMGFLLIEIVEEDFHWHAS